MIRPAYLTAGDTIGLVSPSSAVDTSVLDNAVKVLESRGFRVLVGRYAAGRHNAFSGSDAERVSDLHSMLDNPAVKAIMCSRGGYGAIRLLPLFDVNRIVKQPRWLIGFSDATALHSILLKKAKIECIHGTMPLKFAPAGTPDPDLDSLLAVLGGTMPRFEIAAGKDTRCGTAEGELTGGNLSVLYSLLATPFFPDMRNKILFIEDIGEYIYHVDRMLMSFYLAGVFSSIKGLIAGSFSDMKDSESNPYGHSVYEIISEYADRANIPFVCNFPAGHTHTNKAFVLGRKIHMRSSKSLATIEFSVK